MGGEKPPSLIARWIMGVANFRHKKPAKLDSKTGVGVPNFRHKKTLDEINHPRRYKNHYKTRSYSFTYSQFSRGYGSIYDMRINVVVLLYSHISSDNYQ